jgi:hypothetical protein
MVSYFLSEECKSLKDFQKIHARQFPFRQFCLELANDLKIEVVPPTMHESGSDDHERGHSTPSIAIMYNKREVHFSKPHQIEWRINRRVLHHPSSAQRQSSCVWCCRIDHSIGKRHTRHGRKTTCLMCSTCDVPLCKRPRFNGQSCFLLFHKAETLFDPCCAEAQSTQVSVRSHGNQRAPPSRCTTDLSAGTVGGPIMPPSASRNDIDNDDYIPGNSSGDDDDKISPEHPASHCRTCSTIPIPKRRTRRTRLM